MTFVVDQFAGPGGWDEAARELGFDVLGIEIDPHACATREAAGHRTLQADVAQLDPHKTVPAGGHVDGVIGSPPCPTFSAAGRRGGKKLWDVIVRALREIGEGRDTRAARRAEAQARLEEEGDEHASKDAGLSLLVVEPLRWAIELKPEWIALEQVPDVLPLWEVVAESLRGRGYNVWTGVLSAERYGVPQTRKRAILMAKLSGPVSPPEPTHQAYVPGEAAREEVGLFGSLLPWVSMAEAFGWPSVRRADEPAPTSKGGHDSGDRVWITDTGNTRSGLREEGRSRRTEDPAPVVTSRADQLEWREEPPADVVDRGWVTHLNPRQSPCRSRAVDDPAPTMLAEGLAHGVPVWDRGQKPLRETQSQDKRAARLTVKEAAVLQGFRADYPWQGTSTAKFQQVGNAIPPPLARAVLAVLVG